MQDCLQPRTEKVRKLISPTALTKCLKKIAAVQKVIDERLNSEEPQLLTCHSEDTG